MIWFKDTRILKEFLTVNTLSLKIVDSRIKGSIFFSFFTMRKRKFKKSKRSVRKRKKKNTQTIRQNSFNEGLILNFPLISSFCKKKIQRNVINFTHTRWPNLS